MLRQWLEDLIAIPSPSGHEAEVAAYLVSWAKARSFEVHEDAGNVMVRLPGQDASRAVILHAHMDVVPPGDLSEWRTPPYQATELNGCLFGSGASDDKAGIAVMMAVAESFRDDRPPFDLWLVWVVCEETDGSGSMAFSEWFQANWKSHYRRVGAFLFEPTDHSWIEYEAKGNVFLRIRTEGRGGHGAMKQMLGRSAIALMAEAVPRFDALERHWRALGYRRPTALVTAVRSGDLAAPNRLDSACELVVDIRTSADMHDRVLADVGLALSGIPHRLEVVGDCPAGYTPPDAAFIQYFERVLPGVHKASSEASNDLFAFTRMQVPAFVFGPGSPESIHGPNEFVRLDRLGATVDLIKRFLEELTN